MTASSPTPAADQPATVWDGRFRLDRRLYGTGRLGVSLGTEADGGRPVLITLGPRVRDGSDELALDVPGVPTLLAVCDADGDLSAVVEERPPGAIADPGPERAGAVGAEVAELAAFVHHMGATRLEQIQAIHDGRRRPWTGDPALAPVVDAALGPRRERPTMEALESALRALA